MNTPTQERWQPRYVAYAKDNGRTPAGQREHDHEEYPGGPAVGFMLWISARWQEWAALDRFGQKKHGRWHVRSAEEHVAFDAWLVERNSGR